MKSRWLRNVMAYSLAGVAASASVGAILGWLGSLLPESAEEAALIVAAGIGLLALARTLGVTAIPLPQPMRQTRDVWVKASSPTIAAVRWGLDIGLIFTTRFTYPGTWFLAAVAVAAREPAAGAAIFAAYWIGRAVSVWLGPLLMRSARETPDLMLAVHEQSSTFARTHAVGLAFGTAVLVAGGL